MEHDPDYYDAFFSDEDDEELDDNIIDDLGDAFEFDTCDRIITESELYPDVPDVDPNCSMSAENWGMAFALADELSAEACVQYEIDKRTDAENFKQAMKQNPFINRRSLKRRNEDNTELEFDDLGIEEIYRQDFDRVMHMKKMIDSIR